MLEELEQGEDGEMDVKEKPVESRVHSHHLPGGFICSTGEDSGIQGPVARNWDQTTCGLAPESLFTRQSGHPLHQSHRCLSKVLNCRKK